MRPFVSYLCAAVFVVMVSTSGNAASYRVKQLPGLDPTDYTCANAINDKGDIAGYAWDSGSHGYAIVWGSDISIKWTSEKRKSIGASARSINNLGQVVGEWGRAFFWSSTFGQVDLGEGKAVAINKSGVIAGTQLWYPKGDRKALGFLPGDATSFAYDINDAGVVVGTSSQLGKLREVSVGNVTANVRDPQPRHPFIWNPGKPMIALKMLPNAAEGLPLAINNKGVVVGYQMIQVNNGTTRRNYMWKEDGTAVDLKGGCAVDINDFGQIVGHRPAEVGDMPVIWTAPGITTDLPLLDGHKCGQATAINNRGQIVGKSQTDSNGQDGRAVIWIPTNEATKTEQAARSRTTGLAWFPGWELPVAAFAHSPQHPYTP